MSCGSDIQLHVCSMTFNKERTRNKSIQYTKFYTVYSLYCLYNNIIDKSQLKISEKA